MKRVDPLAAIRAFRRRLASFGGRDAYAPRDGNAVALYVGGGAILEACRELIRSAARTVDIEMYLWSDDAVGNGMVDLLLEAVRRGVTVRAVYDAIGCIGATAHLERLAAGGARVVAFHPFLPWRWRGNPNHRNHRKLLLIDDTAAVLSSANWGLDYAPESNPAAFVDAGLGVAGPVVADLAADFRRIFAIVGETLPEPSAPRPGLPPPGEPIGGVTAQVLSGITRGDRNPIRQVYTFLLKTARSEVVIVNAYFVPGRRFVRLLGKAAQRGVSVSLHLPGRTDQRFVQAATRSTYGRLLRAGVQVFESEARAIHAKAAWVDGAILVLGSANIDPRSFVHNLELNLNVHSPYLVTSLAAAGAGSLLSGRAVDLAAWQRRPLATRLLQHLAYQLRAWL